MKEWGLSPLYILEEMTEEQFALLFEERNNYIRATMTTDQTDQKQQAKEPVRVSAEEMFSNFGIKVETV